MPTKEQWEAEALHQYGLIAVDSKGDAMQLEKVPLFFFDRFVGPGGKRCATLGRGVTRKKVRFFVVDCKLMDCKATNLEILNTS